MRQEQQETNGQIRERPIPAIHSLPKTDVDTIAIAVDTQSADVGLAGHSFPDRNSPDDRTINCIEKTWSKEPYGYQWPASRLSRHEMARLTIVSKQVKRPLNQLIKEAVDAYATNLLHELGFRELDDLILMPPDRDSQEN